MAGHPGDVTQRLLNGKHLSPVSPTRCRIFSASSSVSIVGSALSENYTAEVPSLEIGKTKELGF